MNPNNRLRGARIYLSGPTDLVAWRAEELDSTAEGGET